MQLRLCTLWSARCTLFTWSLTPHFHSRLLQICSLVYFECMVEVTDQGSQPGRRNVAWCMFLCGNCLGTTVVLPIDELLDILLELKGSLCALSILLNSCSWTSAVTSTWMC